ncbi:MAG: arsenate reductase ArsC [Planctomycetes bacterium]|jgi:arsenate reductase|nr:arsenate reductase ArsC [Planctomycetota bacterium]
MNAKKNPKPRVLFLCTGNACRSQMAEGWARHLFGGTIDAFSAGIDPKGVDPRAVRVMAEAGVDLSGQRSKHAKEFLGQPFDLVVTVCDRAKEACPVFPGPGERLHRSFDAPPALAEGAASEEEALAHYRRVRDEVRAFVEEIGRRWVPAGTARPKGRRGGRP